MLVTASCRYSNTDPRWDEATILLTKQVFVLNFLGGVFFNSLAGIVFRNLHHSINVSQCQTVCVHVGLSVSIYAHACIVCMYVCIHMRRHARKYDDEH